MASARFLEILRCRGVDQTAAPYPGMVVPFGGENQVVFETAGIDLEVQGSAVTLQEFDGQLLTARMLQGVRDELAGADVDPQQRDAYMPFTAWQKPRFFRVRGTTKTGFPGAFVKCVPRRTRQRRMASPAVTLQVAVVDQMVVKVAIRNVRARSDRGEMRYHARRPCDPAAEVARMNAIWTPQTNIVFELVPSRDLDVDHTDPKTQEGLTKAYGMKSPATFTAESTVWADKNSPWFAQHRTPGAHMTFFVVHKLLSGGDPVYGKGGIVPNGTMNRELGVSFIADTRLPSTFAHEAGHFVGDMSHEGTDTRLLMRGEGSGYKIPFELARRFRRFAAKPLVP